MAKELIRKGKRTFVINNPEKPKAVEPQPAKEATAKPEKTAAEPSVKDQVLAAMEKGVEYTSTLLRDKLALDKESGRDQIRRAMKRLAKDGKVIISEKSNTGKRKQYVYKLAK